MEENVVEPFKTPLSKLVSAEVHINKLKIKIPRAEYENPQYIESPPLSSLVHDLYENTIFSSCLLQTLRSSLLADTSQNVETLMAGSFSKVLTHFGRALLILTKRKSVC